MAEGDATSLYTSKYTPSDSTGSEVDVDDPYDIALIYNSESNLHEPVSKAKTLLQEKNYKVRDSVEHSYEAGRAVAEQLIKETSSAKYRIVLFNLAYKKHDLPHHAPMLYNRNKTTRKNTLIVLRKKHLKKLPEELHDLQRCEVENITGQQLTEIITNFVVDQGEDVDQSSEKYVQEHKIFKEITDGFSNKRSFLLITNVAHPVPNAAKYLAQVQWIKVFDFDQETREKGLLKVVKPHLVPGKFVITTTDEPPRTPSDMITDWTTLVGTERETNAETSLDAHVRAISQYCSGRKVASLIIFWYPNHQNQDFDLLDLVLRIQIAFQSNRGINCILFTRQIPEHSTALNRIIQPSNKDSYRFVLPLSVSCEWAKEEKVNTSDSGSRLLPCSRLVDETETVLLSERHFNWLSTDMDVLTFSHSQLVRELEVQAGIDFLQGSKISWAAIEDEVFDARRDMLEEVLKYMKSEFIMHGISGAIHIHHHPGSGGTTFGRRVLWEMRKVLPCMDVRQPVEDTEDFREKVKFVRNHTSQQVLLLMDGKADVEKMLTTVPYERVIILNVLRYYGSMENKRPSSGHFYLRDEISKTESAEVFPIYSKYGKHSCELLRQRPRGHKTYMYEYGLTAFTENFRGVRSYVEGHLKIEGDRELWHFVIGYLAMAWHYGQQALPCEMFSHLLKIKRNSTVKKTDIPFHGRQFVKEMGDEWSITYTEVAREILKQLLSNDGNCSPTNSFTLGLKGNARNELKLLALGFIEEMRKSVSNNDAAPRHKLLILRDVFILRKDNNDANEKNQKYSMLLGDVEESEYQGEILRKLVECFPKHADFHAHLGRYYGKSGKDEEAEKSFHKAIEVRMEELASHHVFQESDEVLQRVHHMLGNFYFNRIPILLNYRSRVEAATTDEILDNAKKAIKQFEESRKYFTLWTNPTYSILGEVKVYLRVSKIGNELHLYKMDDDDLESHLIRLRDFSLQSFGICDHLLAQCIDQANEYELQNSEFNYCMNELVKVFGAHFTLLDKTTKHSAKVSSKYCQIGALKRRLTKPGDRFSVFKVRENDTLQRLLELYEAVIRGTTDSKTRISGEMIEWLKIIRRTGTDYSLQKVLEYIDMWDKRKEKTSLSTYYMYVVNVVLAITFPGEKMSQEYRTKAEELRSKLENSEKSLARHVLFRTYEWLGVYTTPTINALVHRDVCGPEQALQTRFLHKCTGTIITVKGWFGWLNLDGFSDPVIRVFFAPERSKVTSQHAQENVRVEFYLGFNARHGAQAFDLVLIETKVCRCGNITEIGSAAVGKSTIRCRVCKRVLEI